MMKKLKKLLCIVAGAVAGLYGQSTTISDTIVSASGVLFVGRMTIQPLRLTYAGITYSNNSPTILDVGLSGTFTINLTPTVGATPANQLYRVDYRSTRGAAWTEYWDVPPSSGGPPLKLTNVVKNYTPAPTGQMAVTQLDGARNASGKYICSDGTRYVNCDPPTSSVQTFSQAFTSQTSLTIAGSTHSLGTSSLLVTVYNTVGQAILAAVAINATTFTVTVTFIDAQSGRIVITRAPSDSESFTESTSVTIFGAVHGLGTANLTGTCFDAGGVQFLYGSLIVDPSTFDATFSFAQAVSGHCVVQGGH